MQCRLEARRQAEGGEEQNIEQIRRGWCFGSAQFREELLDRFGELPGEHHTREISAAGAQTRAERVIAQELSVLGWSEQELKDRPKNHPAKLALAARLRRETTLTTKQIATRLCLGTTKSVTTALHRWMRNNPSVAAATNPAPPTGI